MSESLKGIKCPYCGGSVQVKEGDMFATCPFCGSQFEVDAKSTEQKAYEAFKGRYRAEAEFNEAERKAKQEYEKEQYKQSERRARKKRVKAKVGGAIGCLTPILIFIIIGIVVVNFGPSWIEKIDSKLVNPSTYIDVSFEGLNGKGKVVYALKEDAPFEMSDISTSCYRDGELENGEKVQVHFSPVDSNSLIKSVEKSYTVSGLKGAEKNLDDFTDSIYASIESSSKALLKDALDVNEKSFNGMSREAVYLRYDPDTDTNVLYDVYKLHIIGETRDFGTYIVGVRYEDATIKSNGELSYSSSRQFGDYHSYTFSNAIWCYNSIDEFLSNMKNNKIDNPIYSEKSF